MIPVIVITTVVRSAKTAKCWYFFLNIWKEKSIASRSHKDFVMYHVKMNEILPDTATVIKPSFQ